MCGVGRRRDSCEQGQGEGVQLPQCPGQNDVPKKRVRALTPGECGLTLPVYSRGNRAG